MELQQFGFRQIYGNFSSAISNWDNRILDVDVVGGAPSAWFSTNEFTFGKDMVLDFLGCANLLWSKHTIQQSDLDEYVWEQLPVVRRNFRGYSAPSDDGDPVVPVDISSHFNHKSVSDVFGLNLKSLKSGTLTNGKQNFNLANSENANDNTVIAVGVKGKGENPFIHEVEGIKIDEDVSSLVFLHACVCAERPEECRDNECLLRGAPYTVFCLALVPSVDKKCDDIYHDVESRDDDEIIHGRYSFCCVGRRGSGSGPKGHIPCILSFWRCMTASHI